MQGLAVIKTRGGLLAGGGWPRYPPGCSARLKITRCYHTGRGHFPLWGTASLEKALKLEQSACRGQAFLDFRRSRDSSVWTFSYPLCV